MQDQIDRLQRQLEQMEESLIGHTRHVLEQDSSLRIEAEAEWERRNAELAEQVSDTLEDLIGEGWRVVRSVSE